MASWDSARFREKLRGGVEVERQREVQAACVALARLETAIEKGEAARVPELQEMVFDAVGAIEVEDIAALNAVAEKDPLWERLLELRQQLDDEAEDRDEARP